VTARTLSILLGAPIIVLIAAATAGREPAGFWVPEGFVAQADTLIERGHLELRCGDQDSIAVRFAAGSDEEQFYTLSYLRADVRSYNASPDATRSPFLIDGCRLRGVDPFFHRIDLPFNRLPRWRGDVRFTSDGLSATLEGGRGQLLEVRHPVGLEDAALRTARVSPEDRGARANAPLVQIRRPRTPEVMADFFYVGRSPVLAERIDPGSAERVLVNGFQAPPGRLLRLDAGDWVEFELPRGTGVPARHTYMVETGDRARTASFTRTHNDQVHRLFPAERLRPFLEPFSQAMDLALQSIPGGDDPDAEIANTHVRLTLDRELSSQVEEKLVAWCVRNRHSTRPRAVSMLVMDAFTGAVRAMPSCPGDDELAPYEPLASRTRESVLRNQNLLPHPIGSAGKPFWAAAVATTYPNFLDLQIPQHAGGAADAVLGCPLRAAYNDPHGSVSRVALEEFIERSCNRYMIELATAALAVRSAPGAPDCRSPLRLEQLSGCFVPPKDTARAAQLHFCDRLIPVVLSTDVESVGRSCGELQLLDSKFAPGPVFSTITNVATYRDLSPGPTARAATPGLNERYRAERYRSDAWRRVLRAIEAAGDTSHDAQTRLRFAAVSPQAANLALNTVEELRTDWVNLLLGGENSRWSNYELAEALARLMTGRDVLGEFADSVGTRGYNSELASEHVAILDESQLHPGVRRRVLHAMELVPSTGTARALAPAIAGARERIAALAPEKPYELYVFAKTGTPAVEKFLSSHQQQLVLQLYRSGDLRRERGRLLIRPVTEERLRRTHGDATLRWIRADVLDPMERDPAAFTAHERRLPNHPLYFDEQGELRARDLPDLRVSRQGGVLLLGLLAVPRETGRLAAARHDAWISACPLDPTLRDRILQVPPADLLDPSRAVALSIAIYIDDLPVGEGSNQAIALARDLIEPLIAYIEKSLSGPVLTS
jgi:hypothetical protein